MKYKSLDIPDVVLMTPESFYDKRGVFMETFLQAEFEERCGYYSFVQENIATSKANTLRGIHVQSPKPQGKIVTVLKGRIFDVIVDLRSESPTFGKWISIDLSACQHELLWIPPGLGHGYYTYDDNTTVLYKCTDYYDRSCEHVINWYDSMLNIKWPIANSNDLLVSNKDSNGQSFSSFFANLD